MVLPFDKLMHHSRHLTRINLLPVVIGSVLAFVLFSSSHAAENTGTDPSQIQPETEKSDTRQSAPVSEKEAAFRKFYKRDPACDSFKDDNAMDRCRFEYTRAKREFEKVWAARKDTQ